MTALALTWFEDDDPRDLRRWALAAGIVVAVHASAIGGYMFWQHYNPYDVGDDSAVVSVELAPVEDDVDQPEVASEEQPEQPKVVEQPPPPPDVAALPEEKPVEQAPKPPAPPPMPARVKSGTPTAVAATWETSIVKHLQRFKRYPSEAQAHNEEGTVLLSFSVDRSGHLLSRRIVHSSGHDDLDNEVMAMIDRAQPLPPFPASMTQAKLDLTVPIRFSLR